LLGERRRDYEQFQRLNDSSLTRSEAYLKAHSANKKASALATYFLAESRLSQAFTQARAGNYVGAVLNIHRSKGLYKDALDIDSTFYDASKGIGLFGFFSSLLPSSVQWLSSIFGYEADQQHGLALMKLARDKSRYSRAETSYYLAMIDFLFYQKFGAAECELLRLLSLYPQSAIVHYSLGLVYLETKSLSKARHYFSFTVSHLKQEPDNAFSAYALFRLGELTFRQNNFESAKSFFQQFERIANFSLYTAQLHYYEGLCNEMLGDREEAGRHYKQAKVSGENSDELFAQRKAIGLITTALSPIERSLRLAGNAVDAGNYQQAFDYLNPLLQRQNQLTNDQLAEAFYHMARCYDETGQHEKATFYYQTCYKRFPQKERYLAPFSRYRLALLYVRQKQYDLAEEEFEKSLRYISYDYEPKIKRDVNREMSKLKSAHQTAAN
jgi:tetratricopeptide (TPR) repeat protein